MKGSPLAESQERSPADTRERPKTDGKLPKAVVGLGLVSLFTDTSSEAIFPLLPAFLTTLGASNAFIGLIEGAAEFVANILKYLKPEFLDELSESCRIEQE